MEEARQKARVLLIEDVEDESFLIKRKLMELPLIEVDLTIASTMKEAEDCIAAIFPQIIILDLKLPDSSEEKSVTKIFDFGFFGYVIVLSGSNTYFEQAFYNGAEVYLLKQNLSDYPELLIHSVLMGYFRQKNKAIVNARRFTTKMQSLFEESDYGLTKHIQNEIINTTVRTRSSARSASGGAGGKPANVIAE